MVACHRQQIEDNMALVQEEMGLLTQVEMPGGSVESYVIRLDRVLQRKVLLVVLSLSPFLSFHIILRILLSVSTA